MLSGTGLLCHIVYLTYVNAILRIPLKIEVSNGAYLQIVNTDYQ